MKLHMETNLQALQKLNNRLTGFKHKGLPAAHLAAGNAVKSWIDSNFARQGGLTPNGWPALKNHTQTTGRLLEKSGRLRQNWWVTVASESVSIKAGVSYALAHHYGTDMLPARPLIPEGRTLADLVLPVYQQAFAAGKP